MKHITLTLLVFLSAFANAQISLDHTFSSSSSASGIVLTSGGDKIAVRNNSASQVNLYNHDYTLWKTITLPTFSGYLINNHFYVSDNLFNSDNNIEMIVTYTRVSPFGYKSVIIDEAGNVLVDLDEASYMVVHYINGVYKLFAHDFSAQTSKVYSLPGTIPCGKCGSLGLSKPAPVDETLLAIPNPNNGIFKIAGTGELFITDVAGRKVYSSADYNNSVIDISKYPAGIYNISLNGIQSSFEKQ
ncbi:MAG: hypothetical protein K0Q79_938 [Flavipsychrobacter sp.]|nr:hypothetical protein [Flavipsychrobacter sp.]